MRYKIMGYLILTLMYTAIMSRFYHMKGMSEANFDRAAANRKLEYCHNVIRGMK